ncbi:MAG: hypothetical protein M0T77_05805 [Actinomycetota bacterium]|nr:hypothetical protein [Actinomycetota bacterium]
MAALLPLLWLLILALHLARPYMVRTTQKFSLRLGADLWWVIYIMIRDLLLAVVGIMSVMYLYPDVVLADSLPIGGSLATVALFGVLLVKLLADTDNDPRAFRLVSVLLGTGSALYLVPTMLGVQLTSRVWGHAWVNVARALTTKTDPGPAVALCWISIGAIAVMGLVALWYSLGAPEHTTVSQVRYREV